MISDNMQDYLKTIYKLSQSGEVTTSAVAEQLNVSAASATNMIKKFADLKLARHTPYQGVELTPAGRKIALEVIRHHRLLELYLTEALGYSWDQVHAEPSRASDPRAALGDLLCAGVRAAVVAPEQELARWFSWRWYWDDGLLDELVDAGRVVRVDGHVATGA